MKNVRNVYIVTVGILLVLVVFASDIFQQPKNEYKPDIVVHKGDTLKAGTTEIFVFDDCIHIFDQIKKINRKLHIITSIKLDYCESYQTTDSKTLENYLVYIHYLEDWRTIKHVTLYGRTGKIKFTSIKN